MEPVALSLFASRMEAVCEEMGAVLRRTAFSSNIKDRLDFSCAVFDAQGALGAQAAHIPVHLGSMAYATAQVVAGLEWAPGDTVVLNDPYLGGTHLPDVTLITPVFADGRIIAFVANRAHHADIGAESPGSMPLSRSLHEEGVLIPPAHLLRRGLLDRELLERIVQATGNALESRGDFAAQVSANLVGARRVQELADGLGATVFPQALAALNDYAERLALAALRAIPDGRYAAEDRMDDDGLGQTDLPIRVRLAVQAGRIHADFAGTAAQTRGNINCPLSVAAAALFYVFRCLMPADTPACAGSLRPLTLQAPEGSLVNARRPAAVAAGNVETSSRIVDVVMAALARALPDAMPAASHGSMNNVAMGRRDPHHGWAYYETIGGGMGAGPRGGGLSGVQTHMTNTLNTPIEALEMRLPLRITRYELRRGSGGRGLRAGGDGLVREYELLGPTRITVLSERRRHSPWGLAGGEPGRPGRNLLNGLPLPGKCELLAAPGDRLRIETPGGGGWGDPVDPD
jgi:N-methylhydantoinase B